MAEMIVVEDRNQDDMSRKAGCYLYTDTRLWLENDVVHRGDGPAVISPDGVERWYIRGKEITRNVNMFFLQNQWPARRSSCRGGRILGLEGLDRCCRQPKHATAAGQRLIVAAGLVAQEVEPFLRGQRLRALADLHHRAVRREAQMDQDFVRLHLVLPFYTPEPKPS